MLSTIPCLESSQQKTSPNIYQMSFGGGGEAALAENHQFSPSTLASRSSMLFLLPLLRFFFFFIWCFPHPPPALLLSPQGKLLPQALHPHPHFHRLDFFCHPAPFTSPSPPPPPSTEAAKPGHLQETPEAVSLPWSTEKGSLRVTGSRLSDRIQLQAHDSNRVTQHSGHAWPRSCLRKCSPPARP